MPRTPDAFVEILTEKEVLLTEEDLIAETPLDEMVRAQWVTIDAISAGCAYLEAAGRSLSKMTPHPPWRTEAAEHLVVAVVQARHALDVAMRKRRG